MLTLPVRDERVEDLVVALLELGRAGLAGIAADEGVVALGHGRQDRGRRGASALLRVAPDEGRVWRVEDHVVVRGQRDAGGRRHLRDLAGDVEVDRLDDDGVHALRDDVLSLRDLVRRVILGRLDEDLVAGSLGSLGEERDVRVQVAEGRLLLEHERDLARWCRACSRRRARP